MRYVKVRDHPVMHPQGYQNWPPLWTLTQKDKTKTLTGEVGVLTYVYANDRVSTKCYLVMNHEQEHYIGCMTFDERSFCTKFVALLRKHIGHSIKEIGDLEI